MSHQSREEKKRKKRLTSAKTGSKEGNQAPEVLLEDDIDPADFFDPEEFGVRRKYESFDP
jgi:hypothetical protein